jgi:predicted kinase
MRKWMRERLQRRKKKAEEQESQPAPPPLQPAYFNGEEPSTGDPESRGEKTQSAAGEVEVEPQPATEESGAAEGETPRAQPKSGDTQRTRSRRRRGGRGRGGRVREQAVAQAFTPKGIADVPVQEPESVEPESLEPVAVAEPADAEAPPAPMPQAPAAPVAVPSAPSRPPRGIVVLAIGLPGSGKSTWFKRHNVTPLSSDMVRSLLFDDVREQGFQDLVFSNLRSMLKARLIAKRPMNYVDATNLTPQERQHWIKLAKDYNYEVHAVFFDVPLEVCVERHQRRDRVVPEDVMRRMAAKLKPPSFQEGFAKITVVRVKKKEQEPAEQAEA